MDNYKMKMEQALIDRAKEIAELERTVPHGRCVQCGLALEASDSNNLHTNCANDLYEE